MADTPSTNQEWAKLLQDIIGPQKEWPRRIKNTIWQKSHLKNEDRFKTTVFFMCNGVNPYFIRAFYRHKYNFDRSAWNQVNYIIQKYPRSKWTAWNVAMKKSMYYISFRFRDCSSANFFHLDLSNADLL